jgi:hypothetical protein
MAGTYVRVSRVLGRHQMVQQDFRRPRRFLARARDTGCIASTRRPLRSHRRCRVVVSFPDVYLRSSLIGTLATLGVPTGMLVDRRSPHDFTELHVAGPSCRVFTKINTRNPRRGGLPLGFVRSSICPARRVRGRHSAYCRYAPCGRLNAITVQNQERPCPNRTTSSTRLRNSIVRI